MALSKNITQNDLDEMNHARMEWGHVNNLDIDSIDIRGATAAPWPTSPINGRNGWNGLPGWMQLHRRKSISPPYSKFVSMWNMGKYFFPFGATSVHKQVLFYSQIDWLIAAMKRKKCFFVPRWSWTDENKELFHFSTCWKAFNEQVKCTCVCVVAYGRESNLSATVRYTATFTTKPLKCTEQIWRGQCVLTWPIFHEPCRYGCSWWRSAQYTRSRWGAALPGTRAAHWRRSTRGSSWCLPVLPWDRPRKWPRIPHWNNDKGKKMVKA